ncbi:hypothetical protein GCM10023185_31240 [Hymenobacter saemangeumensis]|uniref:Uncharacterized protein n=1 Tax=Hymenobacter saemangeumensis TaxID=1084522 RepID=A0ABP8IML6_9BACT
MGLPAVAQPQQGLTLTIIPHAYPNIVRQQDIISIADSSSHFHVLLTNTSAQPINIFEEWNTWGYYNLFFELTYPDGRKKTVSKGAENWYRNFPSTTVIPAGRSFVFDVNFDNDSTHRPYWYNSVLNEKGYSTECRMRAIYHCEDSEIAHKKRAWTGTLTSETRDYIFYHLDPALAAQKVSVSKPRKRRFLFFSPR